MTAYLKDTAQSKPGGWNDPRCRGSGASIRGMGVPFPFSRISRTRLLSFKRRRPSLQLLVVMDEDGLTCTSDGQVSGLDGGVDVLTCALFERGDFWGG